MATDRNYGAELDALADGPVAPEDLPAFPGEAAPASTSAPASRAIDRAVFEKEIADFEAVKSARDESNKSLFGDWGKLDEAGQREWIAGEKAHAESEIGFWDGMIQRVEPTYTSFRDYFGRQLSGLAKTAADPEASTFGKVTGAITALGNLPSVLIGDWVVDKSTRNALEARHRWALADDMEKGLMAPPQYAAWRARVDDVARGVGTTFASMTKGMAYTGYGLTLQNMSDAQKSSVYAIGAYLEDKAKEAFPADPARAREFSTALGEGAGSMVAFFGPALAARMIGAVGNLGAVALSGVSGAEAQSGQMVDDALAAYSKTAQAEGRTALTPEEERNATQVWLMGLGIGATEAAPFAAFLGGHGGRMARRILMQMVEEGGQEYVQTLLENAVAQHYYDPDRRWDDNAWTGLAVGSILGAKMQAAGEAVGALRRKPATDGRSEKEPSFRPVSDQGQAVDAVRDVSPSIDPDAAPGRGPSVRMAQADPVLDEARSIIDQVAPPTDVAEGGKLGQGLADIAKQPGAASDLVARVAGALEEGQIPTFKQVLEALPKDENGDPDVSALMERVTEFGAKAWGGLTDEQKAEVYQRFAPVIERAAPIADRVADAIRSGEAGEVVRGIAQRVVAGAQEVAGGQIDQGRANLPPPQKPAPARTEAQIKAAFDKVLASKAKRSAWASEVGVDQAQLDGLISEALKDGRLKKTKAGGIVRTPKAKATGQRTGQDSAPGAATTAAMAGQTTGQVAIDRPTEVRANASKNDLARRYAIEIAEAPSTDAVTEIIDRLRTEKKGTNPALNEIVKILTGRSGKARAKAASYAEIEAAAVRRLAKRPRKTEIQDAIAQAFRDDARDVPEAGVSGAVPGDGEVGPSEGAPLSDGRRGDGDVGRSAGADDQLAESVGELPGTGEGSGGDTGASEGDGQRGVDPPPAAASLTEEQQATVAAQVAADIERADKAQRDRETLNYQITDADQIGKGGPKAKVRGNIEAIRTLRKLQEEKRPARGSGDDRGGGRGQGSPGQEIGPGSTDGTEGRVTPALPDSEAQRAVDAFLAKKGRSEPLFAIGGSKPPKLTLSPEEAAAVRARIAAYIGQRPKAPQNAVHEPFEVTQGLSDWLGMKAGAKITAHLEHIANKRAAKDNIDGGAHPDLDSIERVRAFIEDTLANGSYAIKYEQGEQWNVLRPMPNGEVRTVGIRLDQNRDGAYEVKTAFVARRDVIPGRLEKAFRYNGGIKALKWKRDPAAFGRMLADVRQLAQRVRDPSINKISAELTKIQGEIRARSGKEEDRSGPLAAVGASPSPLTEFRAREAAKAALKIGRAVVLGKSTQDEMRSAMKQMPDILPSNASVGFIVKVTPNRTNTRQPLRAHIELSDGSVGTFDGTFDDILLNRAIFMSTPGGPLVVHVRFSAPGQDGIAALTGERWHETIHALYAAEMFDPASWRLLVDHAESLGVLQTKWKSYLELIRDPRSQTADPDETIAELYYRAYSHRMSPAQLQDALDQESVAIMTELLVMGVDLPLPDEIRRILSMIETGEMARGAGRAGAPEGPLFSVQASQAKSLARHFGATRIEDIGPNDPHPGRVLAQDGSVLDVQNVIDVAGPVSQPEMDRLASRGFDAARYRTSSGWQYQVFSPGHVISATSGEPLFALAGRGAARRLAEAGHPTVLRMYQQAQRLRERGASPEQIWKAAGWAQGADGKWRFEIDDSKAAISVPPRTSVEPRPEKTWRNSVRSFFRVIFTSPPLKGERLGSIMQHDDLYAAYPMLRDLRVRIVEDLESSGAADIRRRASDGKLILHPLQLNATLLSDPAEFRRALLHEVQHYIQRMEGFAAGSAPNEGRYERGGMPPTLSLATEAARRRERGGSSRFDETEAEALLGRYEALRDEGRLAEAILASRDIMRLANVSESDYMREAGETEAREVEAREGMTAAERRSQMPDLGGYVGETTVNPYEIMDELHRRAGFQRRFYAREPEPVPGLDRVTMVRSPGISERLEFMREGNDTPIAVASKHESNIMISLDESDGLADKATASAVYRFLQRSSNSPVSLDGVSGINLDQLHMWADIDPQLVARDMRLYEGALREAVKDRIGDSYDIALVDNNENVVLTRHGEWVLDDPSALDAFDKIHTEFAPDFYGDRRETKGVDSRLRMERQWQEFVTQRGGPIGVRMRDVTPLFAIGGGIPDLPSIDAATGQSMRRDLDELGYYSKALEAARGLKQAKGTPEQMLAQLKKAGVKDAEIEATGLATFRDEPVPEKPGETRRVMTPAPSLGRSITRDEIIAHLEGNRIGLREAFYGGPETFERQGSDTIMEHVPGWMQAVAAGVDLVPGRVGDALHGVLSNQFERIIRRDIEAQTPTGRAGPAKWANYSLDPSNPTYRETVLHLPGMAVDQVSAQQEALVSRSAQLRSDLASLRERLATERGVRRLLPGHNDRVAALMHESDRITRESEAIAAETEAQGRSIREAEQSFQSGHFPEPNIIGHMQASLDTLPPRVVKDADGQMIESGLVYNINQIQSDWGQKLRDGGVRDEAKIAELEKRLLDARKEYDARAAKTNARLDELGLAPSKAVSESERAFDRMEKFDRSLKHAQRDGDSAAIGNLIGLADEVEQLGLALMRAAGPMDLISAEIRTAKAATPGHPLVNTTDQWVNTTLRRAIRQAVEAGADYIAIPHGDTVLSYNPGDTKGMRGFYGSREIEGIVPKNLRKLLTSIDKESPPPQRIEKLMTTKGAQGWKGDDGTEESGRRTTGWESTDATARNFDSSQTGFTLFPITEKVALSVMRDGQPMFALGPGVPGSRQPTPPDIATQPPPDDGLAAPALNAVIQKLKDSLNVIPTQTLLGVRIRAEDGAEVRLNPRRNVRGQTQSATAAVGVRKSRQIDVIAHEMAHALEVTLGAEILDLQQQHRVELEAMSPGATLSEAFADWFSYYITNGPPTVTPGLTQAFEDVIEANAPEMLEGIHEAQAMYQDWLKRSSPEALSSDLVSEYAENSYRDLAPTKSITNRLATAYTNMIGRNNPIWHIGRKLLETADRNGVRDPADPTRPMSLAVHEDPYKIARAFPGAYGMGYAWLTKGIARQGEQTVSHRPLSEALETLFGSTNYRDWVANNPKTVASWKASGSRDFLNPAALLKQIVDRQANSKYQVGGQYLVSKAAIARYEMLDQKEARLADIDDLMERGGQARQQTAAERDRVRGMLERRQDALTRAEALMRDRRNALRSAESTVSRLQERIQDKKDDVLAAQMARDAGLTARRQRDLARLERDSQVAVQSAAVVLDQYETLTTEIALLNAEIEQRRAQVEQSEARVRAIETAMDGLARERKATAERGASRPPTKEPKEWHQDFIAKVEADPKYKDIDKFAAMVHDFAYGLLVRKHQAGFLTPEEFRRYERQKDWYVPLMRDMTDVTPENVFVLHGSASWSPFKKFDGSDRAIINPLETLAQDAYATAKKIMRNNAANALADLAERAGPGSAAIAHVLTTDESMEANAATFDRIKDIALSMGIADQDATRIVHQLEEDYAGTTLEAIWSPSTKGPDARPTMPFYRNGERRLIRLTDPEFGAATFQAFSGLGAEQQTWLGKALAFPARFLTLMITSNPTFALALNLIRDIPTASIITGAPPLVTQYLGLKALRDDDTMRQYMEAGGILGGRNLQMLTQQEQQAKVFDLAKDKPSAFSTVAGTVYGGFTGLAVGGPAGAILGAIAGGYAFSKFDVRKVADAIESMTRVGVAVHAYKRALEHNPSLTPEQAMMEAAYRARAMFDWNDRGSKMLALTQQTAFLNAQLRSLDIAVKSLLGGDSPRGFVVMRAIRNVWDHERAVPLSAQDERELANSYKVVGRVLMLAAIGTAMYMVASSGDDDDEDRLRYEDISDKTKAVRWWFPNVLNSGLDLKIAKPFEWALLGNFIEVAVDNIRGRDPRLWDRMVDSAYSVLAPGVVPQWAQIGAGIGLNVKLDEVPGASKVVKRILGHSADAEDPQRKVISDRLATLDPQSQVDAYTSQISIDIVNGIAKIMPKDMVPSPKTVDFILRVGGIWGSDAQKGYQAAKEAAGFPQREESNWSDYPVIGGFIGQAARQSKSVAEMHRQMAKSGGVMVEAAKGYKHRLDEENSPPEAARWLETLPNEERVYALLEYHGSPSVKRTHPLNRLLAVDVALTRIKADTILDRLTPVHKVNGKAKRNFEETISLNPRKKREVLDIATRLQQAEAWNSFALMGRPGWAGKKEIRVKPILDELKASSPAVAELYEAILREKHVQEFSDVKQDWPDLKARILRDGVGAF